MKKKYTIIGIILIGGLLLIANYQSIFKSLVPPMPEIVNSSADGTSSSLFNYSMKVVGQVVNKGGDVYVLIKATANQAGKKYEKTKQIYLPAHQTEEFKFIFDEVKFLKKEPTYDVETFAVGSLVN
jgi:hypothetical protein